MGWMASCLFPTIPDNVRMENVRFGDCSMRAAMMLVALLSVVHKTIVGAGAPGGVGIVDPPTLIPESPACPSS